MYKFKIFKHDISNKRISYNLKFINPDGKVLFTKNGFKSRRDYENFIIDLKANIINSDIEIIDIT